MSKLKPCPFCGGEAKVHDCADANTPTNINGFGVHCSSCYIATLPYKNEFNAIEAWNRRVSRNDSL